MVVAAVVNVNAAAVEKIDTGLMRVPGWLIGLGKRTTGGEEMGNELSSRGTLSVSK